MKPIRHPEACTILSLREGQPHFGPAARAVFSHAAYTFRHFVKGDDYKWIALACLHEAAVSPTVLQEIAQLIGIVDEDR